jgi:hypothetical protein
VTADNRKGQPRQKRLLGKGQKPSGRGGLNVWGLAYKTIDLAGDGVTSWENPALMKRKTGSHDGLDD